MTVRILEGDCRDVLRTLPDASVHCCVTSPPYFGLRDYGVHSQMGLESTPDEFISGMVAVFREVRRVLRDDGWYLRQDIIWSKPNPMPESVTDRCTKSHEYLFLLSKSQKYHFDQEAILEPSSPNTHARMAQNVEAQIGSARANGGAKSNGNMKAVARGKSKAGEFGVKNNPSFAGSVCLRVPERNKRSVWSIATQPFKEAHFATFPPALVEPCILAGCPQGGVVLDPFFGAGTTGLVADRLQRDCIGIELNTTYAAIARRRIHGDAPLFAEVANA